MVKISDDELAHLATLSNITLNPDEAAGLKADLENIVGYIDLLGELDVQGVEPTYQTVDLQNVWRADEVINYGISREQLINLAHEQLDGQVKVPKVL
ncbi:Asp-tRNA(Asn)/Glu-tRNA(Gln) amidotransferase subunit GatC [Candidatus Saccharibacteria bacterium]|nr:Asp-tRNA(Asn)/Glu-tRNA(Gln) amidotransferase subunit GatC [Candidatus Saccharibacteria bacterium]